MYIFLSLAILTLINVVALGQTIEQQLDVSDQYIITLKPGVDLGKHISHVQNLHAEAETQNTTQPFRGVLDRFAIGSFQAYAGHFNSSLAEQLESHDDVAAVQKDVLLPVQTMDEGECQEDVCRPDNACQKGRCPRSLGVKGGDQDEDIITEEAIDDQGGGNADKAHIDAPPLPRRQLQRCAPYNLHRISHRGFSDTSTYWYVRTAGEGTYAYVLDGGIDPDHVEFGGRVHLGFNAFGDWPPTDGQGHGTYIAGIIGGRKYGVAKKTNLISVKTVHHGHTTLALLLKAYDWTVADVEAQQRQHNSVINISVASATVLDPLNDAINAAWHKGVVTVVPAGNANRNAMTASPASAKGSITVGATDADRVRAHFSNWGPQVMIFAPGVRVCSAWIGGGVHERRRTRKTTGTSAAAAHVAGLVVYFRSFNLLPTPEAVWLMMRNGATRGVVKNAAGSQDYFAYNLSGR